MQLRKKGTQTVRKNTSYSMTHINITSSHVSPGDVCGDSKLLFLRYLSDLWHLLHLQGVNSDL